MLLSINDLRGMTIHATDGDLGKADDFYFDDQDWTIRYLVVDVGSWMARQRVLIAPQSVATIAPDLKRFMTSLTKEQVKNSPDWDSDKPVSRQYEALFADYYQYPYYWGGPAGMGYAGSAVVPSSAPTAQEAADIKAEIEQSSLRSARAVSGYAIEADDGELGTVHDFILDSQNWQIHYLAVDTGKWLPGRKVLISPRWIEGLDWSQSKVRVQGTREAIKNAPGYDNPAMITRDYEQRLFAYYGRRGYWEQTRT